jgi:hypothetical protein
VARTRPAGIAQARQRLSYAEACIEVADLVLDDDRAAMPGVAAGLAVLAGIAAADAICAVRHLEVHRGQSHLEAAELLRTATPDGARLAITLTKLVNIKDEAHYGLIVVPVRKARDSVRRAKLLAGRASDEIGR